jgi:RHS repeat-associated protein
VRATAYDNLGQALTVTDPGTGLVKASYRYTAYGSEDSQGTSKGNLGEDATPSGAEADPTRDVLNPYRYSSKRVDGSDGSYDMGFRSYAPGLNSFLSRDMYNGALADVAMGLDPWNANRYAFAGGNPISHVDLDGHLATELDSGGVSCDAQCAADLEAFIHPPAVEDDGGLWGAVSGAVHHAASWGMSAIKGYQPEVYFSPSGMRDRLAGGVNFAAETLQAANNTTVTGLFLGNKHLGSRASDAFSSAIGADTKSDSFHAGQLGAAIVSLVAGPESVAGRGGTAGETYFRTMSSEHFATLRETGRLAATKETFISPTRSFSEGYDGVLVQFSVRSGTTRALEQIGVRDSSALASARFPNMANVFKGWSSTSAFFKAEGSQINIGLGQGPALDIFNSAILGFRSLS